MVLEGSLSLGGLKFLGADTVVPMFITFMGGDAVLLGFLITLQTLIPALLDLIVGPYASYIRNQTRFCTVTMAMTRPLPLIIMPWVLLLRLDPTIILIAFAISFVGLQCGTGLMVTAWQDLFARVMNERDRDRVYDYQLFIGGAFGVLCGLLVSLLLEADGIEMHVVYAILFGLGGFFSGLSVICMGLVKDVENRRVLPMPEHKLQVLTKYYTGIFRYWTKNKEFRKMYGCELLRNVGCAIFPFVILMGGEVFGMSTAQLSMVVLANVAGGILSGITWRGVSAKFGAKGVIRVSHIMIASIPVLLALSLIGPSVAFIMLLLIECLMGHISNDWVGYSNYLLLIVNEDERPEYLVFRAMLKLPFSFLSILAGAFTAACGYWPLAVITLVVGIAGTISVSFFKRQAD